MAETAATAETRGWSPYPSLTSEADGIAHVFEKIDGSNASVLRDDAGVVHYFSRNRELGPGDKFHGFQSMFSAAITDALPAGIVVYGELFGGWDGVTSQSCVMKRVAYGLRKRFVAFDAMSLATRDFFSYNGLCSLCERLGIDYVKPVHAGPVGETFAWCAANCESFHAWRVSPS